MVLIFEFLDRDRKTKYSKQNGTKHSPDFICS